MLKTTDNRHMDLENIFDYFSDIKIVSNYDGYFYSVNEALKILLLGLFEAVKTLEKDLEWATEDIIKDRLNKEFGIKNVMYIML